MKLMQLNAYNRNNSNSNTTNNNNNNNTNNNMDRVALFNTQDFLWRYPFGFQPSAYQYPPLEFKTHLPNSLASDPRLWSREDVVVFLRWCEYEFDLPAFDMEFFQMNGKALCLLTKSDLNERSPGCGDVLHNVLHMLMRERLPSSPLTPHFPLTPSWSIEFPVSQNSVTLSPAPSVDSQGSPRQPDQPPQNNNPSYLAITNYPYGHSGSSGSTPSDSEGEEPNSPTVQHSVFSPQPQSPVNAKPQIFFPSDNISEPNTNGRLLWDFLQQLLNDSMQRYTSYIAWKNREAGVFKIVDPPGLAKLWGIQKNHLSMNYDKMSRALRYYYRVNILRKVQGERHCYQFLRNPSELKSIKNISLLRHQIGAQQQQQQQQQQQGTPPQPPTPTTPQQPQPPMWQQQPPPPPAPPAPAQQHWQQKQLAPQPSSMAHPALKNEPSEDEPTDLSIHSHTHESGDLSLPKGPHAQAEDLSLSHSIKAEAS